MKTTIKDSRPLPLSLSKDDLHLSPRIIHKYALTVDLNKIASIRTFIRHLNSNESAITRPPLHIRGGYTSWNETLHAIYIYYRILDEDGRMAYNKASCKKLSQNRRDQYNNNIEYLHANRIFIDGSETIINLRDVRIHPYRLPYFNITTNDEIDIIDGTPCPYCNFLLTDPMLKTEEYQKLRNKNPNVNCLKCLMGYKQGIKQVHKNNLLHELVEYQIIKNPKPIQYSQLSIHDPNITSFLKSELGDELATLLLPFVEMKLKIRCITVQPYSPDAKYNRKTLSGAQCSVEDLHSHPNAISDETHFSATVIKFGTSDHADFFVAINDGGYDKDALRQYREDDEMIIKKGDKEFRPGSSAGVTQLEDELTHQKCAQGNTSLSISTETGACVSTIYMSEKTKKVVKLGGTTGVKSRPGLHLKPNKKREYLKAHPYYAKILMKEMITYIKAMACLKACGILPNDGGEFYLSDLKSLLINNNHLLEDKEGLENVLIEYMLGFIEYRNYSAVTCHVDSPSIETISVIDRLGYATNAYLFFPLHNIVYDFTVNESIGVTSLSNSLHVADPSRGHSSSSSGSGGNTSRVNWKSY